MSSKGQNSLEKLAKLSQENQKIILSSDINSAFGHIKLR